MTKDIEAQISLPDGTQISLKGTKASVKEMLAAVTGTARVRSDSGADVGKRSTDASSGAGELLNGVAERDNGNVHIIVSDLKGRNAMDAARRLIYVTLFARSNLLGEKRIDRKVLVAALKEYNLYYGRARDLIANDKGLVRDGKKAIWLSRPATDIARDFIKEIRDPSTKGNWSVASSRRRRSGKSDGVPAAENG